MDDRNATTDTPSLFSFPHPVDEVSARLVAAGVPSILNFAPTVVTVPDDVGLRKVDLATELHILGYYEHRRGANRATG